MKNKFEIRGDKVVIFLDKMDGRVLETVIDMDDLEKVQKYSGKWIAAWDPGTQSFYVQGNSSRRQGNRTTIRLHRLIADCPKGLQIDHINHDTLNNTQKNIRIVTPSENQQNARTRKGSKSGLRGVYWDKTTKSWRAMIVINYKNYYLGTFLNPLEAAEVVKKARNNIIPCYQD